MRILVLDGNENQAVACVRSLARAGYRVVVGAPTSWSKAGWSRGCERTFTYTAPQRDAAGFVNSVVEEIRRQPGALVMPLTERTTLPLSVERRLVFRAGGRMVMPKHENLLRAFDKQETTRLAERLGIAVPRTMLISERKQAAPALREIGCPAVLKPRSSEEITASAQVRTTGAPCYAANADEFLTAYDVVHRRCEAVLAQEFVAGNGEGYFALMKAGELRAEFAHRRIRDVRPSGSGSAVRVSVYPDNELRDAALAILHALNWHGAAMVEFRRRPDGSLVFMEVNGRFWNSLALAIYAGVDFPLILAQLAERGEVNAATRYRAGVRCRWLVGDFRHLVEVWRGAPQGYPCKYPNRWRTLFDVVRPVRGTFHDNFTISDPLPELGDWLDFALRQLPAQWNKQRSEGKKEFHVQRRYSHS